MEEKGEREEFEEEESRLLQVSGVIEAVPDVVGVGDEARLPASTSPIVLYISKTSSPSWFLLQTRSWATVRCVTWMQQWVSQPQVTSVNRTHKCGYTELVY